MSHLDSLSLNFSTKREPQPRNAYFGFSDTLKTEALRAAPTDKTFSLSSVGLNLSVGDKESQNFILCLIG
jgi:hypothetical protein